MIYAVIGAGRMARAVVHDLLEHPAPELIKIGDIDPHRAEELCCSFGNECLEAHGLNAGNMAQLDAFLGHVDVVVSAASYTVNLEILHSCLRTKTNMVDMGGNTDVVLAQLALNGEARAAGITAIPDMGLAPGLVSVLSAAFVESLDRVQEIRLRVGGLPRNPEPPLNYGLVFSAEGLINEYVEECLVLRNGLLARTPALSEVEEMNFPEPFGKMEAFHTSGGSSTLPYTLQGTVRDMDYKTIRYPGHCEMMRAMLDIGFRSHEPIVVEGQRIRPRKVLERLLEMNLPTLEDDVVLLRCWAVGQRDGEGVRVQFDMVDYSHEGLTSMMRTTGFPVAIVARMIAEGRIARKGVLPPERAVPPEDMLGELAARGVKIEKTEGPV